MRVFVARASIAIAFAIGCTHPDDTTPPPANVLSCPSSEDARGEVCVPKLEACATTEIPKHGGGCSIIGVPKDGCADGFAHDGAGGCTPTVPKEPCAPGKMFTLGETSCRDVAPCGSAPYGEVPDEPSNVYVDASYVGTSDGSKTKPFTTIDAAVKSAPASANAIVAIAAGTYVENLRIIKPIRLYGRCPSMVEIKGADSAPGTYTLESFSPIEIHRVAVTGPSVAISLRDVQKGLLDQVWVHDAGDFGVDLQEPKVPTTITVRDSLIEKNRWTGIFVASAKVIVESTTIRDSIANTDKLGGTGIVARPFTGRTGGSLEVRRSVIEGNQFAGIEVYGIVGSIDGSLIRETKPIEATGQALGVSVWKDTKGNVGELTVKRSVIDRHHGFGLVVNGGHAVVESTVVRDVAAGGAGQAGVGINVAKGGILELRDSLVANAHYAGIYVGGAKGTIERTIVRDTLPQVSDHGFGVGVAFAFDKTGTEGSLIDSLVTGSHYVGVIVVGSTATIERTHVLGTKAQKSDGKYGDAIAAAATTIEGPGEPGDVIPASISLVDSTMIGSARAAVSVFGAEASLSGSVLTCGAFDLEVSRTLAGKSKGTSDFKLQDGGRNVCGCAAAWKSCKAQSNGLEPAGL